MSMTEREREIAIRMLEYARKYCDQNHYDIDQTAEHVQVNEFALEGMHAGVKRCVAAIDVLLDEDYELDDLVRDITDDEEE